MTFYDNFMSSNQLITFIAGSVLLVLVSWFVSIREKRYHGIPRFFAFEGLLLMGILQRKVWFQDPLSPLHIISWILLTACIIYVISAMLLYFRNAKPGVNFENSTRLVTTGLYKYVRHPMYASLLLLGWGMFFKEMNPITIVLICIITIALFFTCKVEEKEMILRFGVEYEEYMSSTKMWFPFVF